MSDVNIIEKSWYMKYQPKVLDDLIFDSDEHKKCINRFIENDYIDGNILLYGPGGLGKTATSEILINSLIKASNDVLKVKEFGVAYVNEVIKPFVIKRPIKSKKKIVYVEEADKFKYDAQNLLKRDTLEKYQDITSFIFCTNKIYDLEGPLLQRFDYKLAFTGTNIEGYYQRLYKILKLESAEFDELELKKYAKRVFSQIAREDKTVNIIRAHLRK